MQLKVLERVCLLNILPKEGDFLTLQVARDISDEVSFKPDELEALGMQTANGVTTWNQDADVGAEFTFSEAATSVIVGELQKLDKGKKLTMSHVGLYKLFVLKQAPTNRISQGEKLQECAANGQKA